MCSTTGSRRRSSGRKSSEGSQHLRSEVHELALVSVLLRPRQKPEQLDMAMLEEKNPNLGKNKAFPHYPAPGFSKGTGGKGFGRVGKNFWNKPTCPHQLLHVVFDCMVVFSHPSPS